METRRGLVLDRVVLLGRTFEEYCRYFAIDPNQARSLEILDVASGVSSFCVEAHQAGWRVTATDPIYETSVEEIAPRCQADLESVVRDIGLAQTYRWDFYGSPAGMKTYRERAYRAFLADYAVARGTRYVAGRLPSLPFPDGRFDLTLVSYLLLVYEDQLDYEFHRRALRELLRVTSGEIRIYPTVTFEARPPQWLDRWRNDVEFAGIEIREVATDFEFLLGSNAYLSIRRKP